MRKITDPDRTQPTRARLRDGTEKIYHRYPSITIYIPPAVHRDLSDRFPTKTNGLQRVAEYYFELRRVLLQTIFKGFTEPELVCLIDSFDFEMDNSKFMANKDMIIMLLDHNDKKEGLSEMYNVSMFNIIEKLNKLNTTEVFFFIDEIRGMKEMEIKGFDMSEMIEKLIKD